MQAVEKSLQARVLVEAGEVTPERGPDVGPWQGTKNHDYSRDAN
jgi:hypothetical protein